MQACGGSNTSPSPPTTKTIAQIRVVGQPVIVFDHTTDQKQPLNIPDEQITAWREADGTVNLMIPHYEAYRMRGPDLLHLTMDPNEIYSSSQSGSQITENLYNYHHWLAGPYSLDGHIFYSLAHSEWYACLLGIAIRQAPTAWTRDTVAGRTRSIPLCQRMVELRGNSMWSMAITL